jgi:maleate isomerase
LHLRSAYHSLPALNAQDEFVIHSIGMLVPSTNSAGEVETNRLLPNNYEVHTGRLRLSAVDGVGWAEQDADIDYQSQLLGDINPDVVILLQTSASFYGPEDYDEQVAQRMAEHSGAPGVTTAHAMGRALHALDAPRVAIVSPYSDDLNARAKRYFERVHGLSVVAVEGLNMTDPQIIGKLEADIVTEAVERAAVPEADAVIMAGGAFRALNVIADWEQRIGKPVVTTNQVMMWAAVQAVGGEETITGHGQLLASMPKG